MRLFGSHDGVVELEDIGEALGQARQLVAYFGHQVDETLVDQFTPSTRQTTQAFDELTAHLVSKRDEPDHASDQQARDTSGTRREANMANRRARNVDLANATGRPGRARGEVQLFRGPDGIYRPAVQA